MKSYYKDIVTGIMFLGGLLGFVSGEFIFSSALFASAAITSNLSRDHKVSSAER